MLELRLKKSELLKGVSQTQSIAEKRSSMPILSNVLLEVESNRLAITATDLEISFKGTYEATIKQEGRLTVPARKFYEIVRVMGDEELSLVETENFGLELTASRSKYHLNGLSPDDFPPMPDFEEVPFVSLPGELIVDMIEKTIFSIAMEETRYNLAGIYFEKEDKGPVGLIRMVSTDGHRLSLIEKESEILKTLGLDKGVIMSRKGMTELRKLAEESENLEVGFTANSAVIKSEGVILVMRLLEGRFPDYRMVIPKGNDKILSVSRKDFLEMMRRVSVMSSDDFKGVKFSLAPKELTLTVVNPDLGEARESMPVDYEGETVEVGFNPRYFIEALGALKSDTVQVALQGKDHPCELTADDDPGYHGVIMPMKI